MADLSSYPDHTDLAHDPSRLPRKNSAPGLATVFPRPDWRKPPCREAEGIGLFLPVFRAVL